MEQIRNGFYYLFNSTTNKEKLIYVNNEKFEDIDILSEKDSFALGTHLSGLVEILPLICECVFETAPNFERIIEIIKAKYNYLPIDNVLYAQKLATCICSCISNSAQKESLERDIENVNYLHNYICLCEENKEFCKTDILIRYTSCKALLIKREEIMFSEVNKDDGTEMICFLQSSKNKPDIHIYKIESLADLILSLMQAIFLKNKIIKTCKNCYRLFVPLKRNNEKYCNYNIIGEYGICKNQGYEYNRKTHFINKDIRILYNRIRSRLYERWEYVKEIRTDEKENEEKLEYTEFLKKYIDFYEKIAEKKLTEEDLYRWLLGMEQKTRRR